MKIILLHIHDDDAADCRLQVALDLARAHGAHLHCLQVTPYTAYVAGDGFSGAAYIMTDIVDAVAAHERQLRADTSAALKHEDVPWSYERCDGDPATTIVQRARLADLVVLSRALKVRREREPLPLAGDVALHGRTPVLAVPTGTKQFDETGPALVAWNGSAEAANALKAALPMLRRASAVNLVTITEPSDTPFPAIEACRYLARHDVKAEVHAVAPDGQGAGEALVGALATIGGAYLVMGAYGHSRAREYLLGGATRHLLGNCPVPLLLAH